MRLLLLDDALPATLAAELERRGRPARSVAEEDHAGATDAEVLALTAREDAVLVTTEERLPSVRGTGAAIAVVRGDEATRRETVHRWAHEMAAQRPGSRRRYP